MLEKLNWLIVATFGVATPTAAAMAAVITKAVGGAITWSRALQLLALTGVGAIVIAGIAAIGFWWLSQYVKKNGEAGLTAW